MSKEQNLAVDTVNDHISQCDEAAWPQEEGADVESPLLPTVRVDSSECWHELIKFFDRLPVTSGLKPHVLERYQTENSVDDERINPPLLEDLGETIPRLLNFGQFEVS